MSGLFTSPAAQQQMIGWYERFRADIGVPTVERTVPTRFGEASMLVGGPEGAPPLVLLHGAMASSAHGLRELAPLLERFRVYAVDVVGQSPKGAQVRLSVKNSDYGQWLAEVLDGLGLKQTFVVGVSWGGFVALRLAAFAPERISRLALLVPAGVVSGNAWKGFVEMGLPMAMYKFAPSEARLRRLLAPLLTTDDDQWVPYMGEAFRSYDLSGMRVPVLAKEGEFAGLKAPVMVLAAELDLSFPGAALLARAKVLLPTMVDGEVMPGIKHCPPTNEAFRRQLAERVGGFLLG
jgi:pimeloyl-ACP methyl ester carboxylesterase